MSGPEKIKTFICYHCGRETPDYRAFEQADGWIICDRHERHLTEQEQDVMHRALRRSVTVIHKAK